MEKRNYSLEDFEGDTESTAMARRREFPDMIRDIAITGHKCITFTMDIQTALNLADDLQFAVENREL